MEAVLVKYLYFVSSLYTLEHGKQRCILCIHSRKVFYVLHLWILLIPLEEDLRRKPSNIMLYICLIFPIQFHTLQSTRVADVAAAFERVYCRSLP